MSDAFEPIPGQARIGYSDMVRYSAGVAARRLALMALLVGAVLGFTGWQVFFGLPVAVEAQARAQLAADFWQSMGMVGVLMVPWLLALLLFWMVVLPALALWRAGAAGRDLRWVITESGIRRTDGTGAENLLPWGNIRRVSRGRHLLWVQVKPRAWRYLPCRAFSPADVGRLEVLARRMLG